MNKAILTADDIKYQQTGTYHVGTRLLSITDHSRKEQLGPATGNRKISVRIYYPANPSSNPPVNLGKKVGGVMYDNATPIHDQSFPLIVYSHGYGAFMESNNLLCCELASHGYFVAAIGHTYEASEVSFEDGTKIKSDKTIKRKMIQPKYKGYKAAMQLKKMDATPNLAYPKLLDFQETYCTFMVNRLSEWAKDAITVVEFLKASYADSIDFSVGIGATGHSFGGNLAYYLCQFYDEFRCGINIDGSIFGRYKKMRMKSPFFQICSKVTLPMVSKVFLDTDAPVYLAVFDKMQHIGYTDMKFYFKPKFMLGTMPAKDMSDALLKCHRDFFNHYLKGLDHPIDTTNTKYITYTTYNKE